jgi:GNAT superfamily N-acetyltransferase
MKFEIKKLSAEMASDYIDLFEKHGLIDGDINKGCYCVWHHWTNQHENERSKLPKKEQEFVKRDFAIKLIQECKLNGFVAYLDDRMVGFCNADFKENYYRHSRKNNPDSWVGLDENDKILTVVCYVVDVNMRGKGVATALLEGVCKYAVENEYDYIEAYPSLNEFSSTHCGGPFSMYAKKGFLLVDSDSQITEKIARKKLKQ